uniref:Uncharacterized protein LOC114339252 n=1 Tax=Diabrotica virgifera virgifera TaxID=50390 RepID=A0A6P7GKD4_DIAVI
MLHFYFIKKENLDIGTSEDLSLFLSTAGLTYIAISFSVYSKNWSKIIQSLTLTAYKKFGKPPKTDEKIKFWNRIMLMNLIYFLFMVTATEIATLYGSTECAQEAERK